MTVRAAREDLERRIERALALSGRPPGSARLIGVSKTVAAARVCEAIDAGVTAFGENYVQEAARKIAEVTASLPHVLAPHGPVEFHLIGHLQRNKVKDAVRLFSLIHTVDRPELVAALQRSASDASRVVPVLLQVNTSREPSKSGVAPEAAFALAESVIAAPGLELKGLMCIGRFVDDGDDRARRSDFRMLAEIRADLSKKLSVELPHLSMGMSHDFEIAIEEGATLIRVGTALFGERAERETAKETP